MAYSTLLSLKNDINQILGHDRISISPHEKKLIISIDEYVVFFQAFFENFPQKTKIFEARIRDAAGRAEGIIELFLLEEMGRFSDMKNGIRIKTQRSNMLEYMRQKVRGFMDSTQRPSMFENELHKVRDELESIAVEVVEKKDSIITKDVQLDDIVGVNSSSQVADNRKTNVVGFNEDLKEIKDKLCGCGLQLQVLPIFGMGGIGKTTLARNTYDDQLIVEHFQIRVWVPVSQDYSERRILSDLLDAMKEFDPESMVERFERGKESPAEILNHSTESLAEIPEISNSDMALKVHKILTGRKFLIVMDDIWSTKVLDDVKHFFPNCNNGSRIILTTRLIEVARYAKSSILPHEMRLMDADQSWNLLWKKVFIHQDRVPPELDSTGREIARSCGGLPLAIVVIAGHLLTINKTVTSWEEVARNIGSSLATADGQIEKILSLSYNHLPHHLRPCFLYMGGFPEDHEIKVTDLIRLWIAESFVKSKVSKEFEDTAEEYLEDLVDKSLIVVTKRKSNGKIKCCSLHDMVREMCIKLSEEEKFLVHVKGSRAQELLRSVKDELRVSISHSNLSSLAILHSSTIRTIMYFENRLMYFGSLRSLRILNMLSARSQSITLSDEFFQLFHLRYLAFCNFNPIPRTISNLQSLQTLVIEDFNHSDLPCEIWNLQQLRHLLISNSCLADTTAIITTLESLQTLVVKNLACSVTTLELIPNLTKLRLKYSSGFGELLFHNLVHLNRLEKLHLELGYDWTESSKPYLVVPTSLKKLTLTGWGYRNPYLDIVGPFPNLEVLKLKRFNFSAQEWRTCGEDFPRLEYLLVDESDLMEWETESSHFPRLKALRIHSCLGLSEIPECIGEIPTLELIDLYRCTDSLANSAKQVQEEAHSNGDDVLQVRCIDCVAIEEWPGTM